MIQVFLTDDHEMYLEGLALLMARIEGVKVIGTASTAGSLLEQLPSMEADILLMDVHLPDMEEEALLHKIREIKPAQKIAYLTLMRGTKYIHKLYKHGIQGYMLKNISIEELHEAMVKIYEGGTYFSADINLAGADEDSRNTITIQGRNLSEILSKREWQVLKLICKEFNNAEIAEQLVLSVSTIETHRRNLISKLGVQNTVGLVKFAYRNKIIQ